MARHYRLYWVMLLVLLLGGFALAQQPQRQNPAQQPSPASQNPSTPETTTPGTESKAPGQVENPTPNEKPPQQVPVIHNDAGIKGGTLLTVTHRRIENGSASIHHGNMPRLGKSVQAPTNATSMSATCTW